MANPWHIGNTTVRTPYRLRDALIALAHSEYHGNLVFDPFCGSGTTGVVCKKQNREFVGIDNNIEYLNIAKKRLASATNRNN